MNPEYQIKTLVELEDFAKDFLKQFPTGCVAALRGEIGAGKTTFVKTIMGLLSTADNVIHVTSPTYTIHQVYDSPNLKAHVDHFDFYRLTDNSLQNLIEIGYFEIVNRARDRGGYVFVEWADLFKPMNLLQLDVEVVIHLQANTRIINTIY